jgi:hypothetical protein
MTMFNMVTRKQFMHFATAMGGGSRAQEAGSSAASDETYEAAARRIWRPAELRSGEASLIRHELIRYATLASSSHNTQCWRFRDEGHAIAILPDFSRRCPAVDPDDHHLFVSLGCAAENLIQAALASGLKGEPHVDAAAAGGLRIILDPTRAVVSPLFKAIPARQSTRAEFDGKPLSTNELKLLEQAGTGNGVRVLLLTEKPAMEKILAYVIEGNTAQMNDPAFVEELKAWIRFGRNEALRTGDGLFAGLSGNPSVPRWLGSRLFNMFFTRGRENDKYARHVRSSAGIAVFVSDVDDKAHWIEAGRCYERFALQSTALGIRNAFVNQPVEVAALRPQFAASLGVGARRPDLVIRFGRGPTMPPSLRRPVEAVLA